MESQAHPRSTTVFKELKSNWVKLDKEPSEVREERRGQQNEMRSCDSLLCRWGESATPELSERFPIHHCRILRASVWVCVLLMVLQSICVAATISDWSPFCSDYRSTVLGLRLARGCLRALIKAGMTPEISAVGGFALTHTLFFFFHSLSTLSVSCRSSD